MKIKFCKEKKKVFRSLCLTIETLEEFQGLFELLGKAEGDLSTKTYHIYDKLDVFADENNIER